MMHKNQESALFTVTGLLQRLQLRNSKMEEMCRARYERRCEGLSCPLGLHHLPSTSMCSPPQKLSEPHHLGLHRVLLRFHCIGIID